MPESRGPRSAGMSLSKALPTCAAKKTVASNIRKNHLAQIWWDFVKRIGTIKPIRSWYHPYPRSQSLKDRFKSYMWWLCVFWEAQQQTPPDTPSVPPSQTQWQRIRTTFTRILQVGFNHTQPCPKPLQHDTLLAPASQVQWPRVTRTFQLRFELWIQNLLDVLGFQSTELSPLALGY
jgi:hypothetical protein